LRNFTSIGALSPIIAAIACVAPSQKSARRHD
jgi:hypothetical protein